MKHIPLLVVLVTSFATLAGCASPLVQRAQRAGGLLDFLAGNPGEIAVPVEIINGGSGRIEAARMRVHGGTAFVSGFVRRAFPGAPRPSAHVDVMVVDARQHLAETQQADYLPRAIPSGQHGGFAHSSFTVRLAAPPLPGGTVKVMFHDSPKATCDFNPLFAAR